MPVDETTQNGTGTHAGEPVDIGPLYSLKDIERELGVTYERLRGFAESASEALGGVFVPGKGRKYPYAAKAKFKALVEASERGEVTPRTADAWLKAREDTELPAGAPDTAVVPTSQVPVEPPTLNLEVGENFAEVLGKSISDVLFDPNKEGSLGSLVRQLADMTERSSRGHELTADTLRQMMGGLQQTVSTLGQLVPSTVALGERVSTLEREVATLKEHKDQKGSWWRRR